MAKKKQHSETKPAVQKTVQRLTQTLAKPAVQKAVQRITGKHLHAMWLKTQIRGTSNTIRMLGNCHTHKEAVEQLVQKRAKLISDLAAYNNKDKQ